MIEWVVDKPGVRLGLGDSVNYEGDADLVFTHLYGPLPAQLIGKPAIINLFGSKREAAERWCGAELIEVSKWGHGLKNTIYVANMDEPTFDFHQDLIEDEGGWFPQELCSGLLSGVSGFERGATVWDGFMGRGSVGLASWLAGFRFVGIDRDPDRIAMAMEYLGC